MGSRRALLVWLGLSGCGNILGISDLSGPSTVDSNTDSGSNPNLLPECKAQRFVMLVGGNGGLAWFTQIWPIPIVITGFQPTYSYDNPQLAQLVSNDPAHPLYARVINGQPVLAGRGTSPLVTVMVAGRNDTHVQAPTEIMEASMGVGVAAAATVIQAPLAPTFGAVSIGNAGPYGTAPGAAAIVNVGDAAGLADVLGPTTTPTASQLGQYLPGTPDNATLALGTALATIANGFRDNAVGTAIVPAFLDDPHGAFTSGIVTTRANALGTMLNAFYADLAASNERDCGHDGKPLSLADNTVITVTGDTYKDPFVANAWGDGTPNASNLLYLRANGFIKPGWFGSINATNSATSFDPVTGGLGAPAPGTAEVNASAQASIVYSIARGDLTTTQRFSSGVLTGERAQ